MSTLRLVPSTYSLSNTTYASISGVANAYTNVDSTTYATFTTSQRSTTARYVYFRGFDFSAVPSDAIIDSFTVKVRLRETGASTTVANGPAIVNNTTVLVSASSGLTTTATTYTLPVGSNTFATLKGYGSNFGVRVALARAKQNTQGYIYIYGVEIEVNYHLPGEGPQLMIKVNGAYKEVSEVWEKVNGVYVKRLYTDYPTLFNTTTLIQGS